MSKPVLVQIAFQGGGARAAALLAAVEAIEEAERNGEILVTRVSGTSAGALAAAILAARIPAQRVKNRLLAIGDDGLAKLFPPLSILRKAWLVLRGVPFYPDTKLKQLLKHLLQPEQDGRPEFDKEDDLPELRGSRGRVKPRNPKERGLDEDSTYAEIIEDGGRPCFVTVAHLRSGHRIDRSGEGPPVLQSLRNSSGLPFVFRAPKNMSDDNPTLDGGLCENLPIEDLARDTAIYGEVFAVAFAPPKLDIPRNAQEMLLMLFDLMINHNVTKARSKLRRKSALSLVPTALKTTDFTRICSIGLSDKNYRNALDSVTRDLDNWLKPKPPTSSITVADTLDQLRTIFDTIETKYNVVRSVLTVVARSFAPDREKTAEEIVSITEVEPTNEPLRGYQEYIGSSVASAETEWKVWELDEGGHRAQARELVKVPLPSAKVDAPSRLGLVFDPPLQPSRRYQIHARSTLRACLEALRKVNGTDFLANTLLKSLGTSKTVLDVILVAPAKVRLSGNAESARPLTNAELAEFDEIYPSGFVAQGWRREGAEPGDSLHLTLRRLEDAT
jgi:predicted acylesterase/phospholipase RssA